MQSHHWHYGLWKLSIGAASCLLNNFSCCLQHQEQYVECKYFPSFSELRTVAGRGLQNAVKSTKIKLIIAD